MDFLKNCKKEIIIARLIKSKLNEIPLSDLEHSFNRHTPFIGKGNNVAKSKKKGKTSVLLNNRLKTPRDFLNFLKKQIELIINQSNLIYQSGGLNLFGKPDKPYLYYSNNHDEFHIKLTSFEKIYEFSNKKYCNYTIFKLLNGKWNFWFDYKCVEDNQLVKYINTYIPFNMLYQFHRYSDDEIKYFKKEEKSLKEKGLL